MSLSQPFASNLGLSGLIYKVQSAMPDWLVVTIGSSSNDEGRHNFHMKLNDLFIPLDHEDPCSTVNDLIDHMHHFAFYEPSIADVSISRAFKVSDYFHLEPLIFYEILNNIGYIPVLIYITKKSWYVSVHESGFFYPLRHVSASEFLDYIYSFVE